MALQIWLPFTTNNGTTNPLHNQGLISGWELSIGGIFRNANLLERVTGRPGKLDNSCCSLSAGAYLLGPSITSDMKSATAWIMLTNSDAQVVFADYKSKLAFGIYNSYLVCSCADTNFKTCYNASIIIPYINKWMHIAVVKTDSKFELYINGELMSPISTLDTWSTNMSDRFTIGARSNGTTTSNMFIQDFRLYDNVLSAKQVKDISRGLMLHYQLTGPKITSQYDHTFYTEPDGTVWTRIFHHNNPGGGVFSSTDSFASGVYKDANRWYDIEGILKFSNSSGFIIDHGYEFMIKQKTTSSAQEVKYRWLQYNNPLFADWNDVQPNYITRITTDGYTDGSYGGLYLNTGSQSTRFIIANSNSSNWYGAIGCWTNYQNGIPGYPNTVITTGYMDLYICIDNWYSHTEFDCSGYNHNGGIDGAGFYTADAPKYAKSLYYIREGGLR